jgi:MraZ protein
MNIYSWSFLFMALFLSTFVNKVDAKGRVSVPAAFRAALTQEVFQGFVAFRSYKHNAIECCSHSRMALLSGSLDNLDLFSEEQDDLTATIFADALQLPFDGDGRIILPKKLSDFAHITDRAAFVGRGATFQIWSPEEFEPIQEQARVRAKERQSTLRLSLATDKKEHS